MELDVESITDAELIDKVMLSDDVNYLNLISSCISELPANTEQETAEETVVEVFAENRKVKKYYKGTDEAVVHNHFARSLVNESSLKMMEVRMTEEAAPVKKTGASKRKARRKPTVTSLLPTRAQVTTDARVYPYTHLQPACNQQARHLSTVQTQGGAYLLTRIPHHYFHHQTCESLEDSEPPVYTAFYKGKTLVETYSPRVGRGFNPRYNSQLIEPTIQPFLPPITGASTTMAAAMADLHTFRQMAIEFNIPNVQ